MAKAPFLEQMRQDLGIPSDDPMASVTRERVWYDTGSLVLNLLINHLGRGVPGGHIAEFFGEEASGKSLLAYMALISAQKCENGIAALIDTEGAYNPEFLHRLGLDLDNFLYIPPTMIRDIGGKKDLKSPITMDDVAHTIEYILKKTDETYDTPPPGVIVWDSIAMTNAYADLGLKKETNSGKVKKHNQNENAVADSGRIAKDLRQILQRIAPRIHSSNFALVAINHVFDNIAKPGEYLVEKTTSRGGRAPKYHSRLRLEFAKGKGKKGKIFAVPDDAESQVIGEKLHVYVKKNSVGPPYGKAVLEFYFGLDGKPQLDYYSGYFDYLISIGKITASGAWYSFVRSDGEVVKVQGKNLNKLFEKAPELRKGPDADVPA